MPTILDLAYNGTYAGWSPNNRGEGRLEVYNYNGKSYIYDPLTDIVIEW